MKKVLFPALILLFTAISCSDDGPDPVTPSAAAYMNLKAGSTWNYEQINTSPAAPTVNYTLTSTNRDSTIDGNSFHVFTNSSTNASEYYRISGNDHLTFQNLPAALSGAKVTNLYLKAGGAVGSSWQQTYPITFSGIPLVVTVTHTIEEIGLSKTVNTVSYSNVIRVKTGITVAGIPASALTSDINSYYAPNAGLIENRTKIDLNYMGIISNTDMTTRLKTANLIN